MSDEYLWSKRGSDVEIEGLEDLLSEFRYVPDRSVQMPVTHSVVEPATPRRFRWVLAFAVPAFATLLFAIWFMSPASEGSLQARKQIEEQSQGQVENEVAPKVENSTTASTASYKPVTSRKSTPTIVKTIFRPRATKRQQIESLVASNKLTKEEKYAYDRLMLALSIAGNKLKVVQDTIDRKSDFDQKVFNSNK